MYLWFSLDICLGVRRLNYMAAFFLALDEVIKSDGNYISR